MQADEEAMARVKAERQAVRRREATRLRVLQRRNSNPASGSKASSSRTLDEKYMYENRGNDLPTVHEEVQATLDWLLMSDDLSDFSVSTAHEASLVQRALVLLHRQEQSWITKQYAPATGAERERRDRIERIFTFSNLAIMRFQTKDEEIINANPAEVAITGIRSFKSSTSKPTFSAQRVSPLIAAKGICSDSHTEKFYPFETDDLLPIRAICYVCPVIRECAEFAITSDQHDGFWGGTSEEDRDELRRRIKKGEGWDVIMLQVKEWQEERSKEVMYFYEGIRQYNLDVAAKAKAEAEAALENKTP